MDDQDFRYYYAEVALRSMETALDSWGNGIAVSRIPVPKGFQLYSVVKVENNVAQIILVKYREATVTKS